MVERNTQELLPDFTGRGQYQDRTWQHGVYSFGSSREPIRHWLDVMISIMNLLFGSIMASIFSPLPLQRAQVVHLEARLVLGSRSLCAGGKLTNERPNGFAVPRSIWAVCPCVYLGIHSSGFGPLYRLLEHQTTPQLLPCLLTCLRLRYYVYTSGGWYGYCSGVDVLDTVVLG